MASSQASAEVIRLDFATLKMGRNDKCACFFVGVCLLMFNLSSVESRTQIKSHAHDFYGAYNPCKYNIWPWPSKVDCTSTKNRDRVLSKDFQVFVTEESLAKNSSILLKGMTIKLLVLF